jgi:transcriptional regulator with PAS, ATPase and Fis domain
VNADFVVDSLNVRLSTLPIKQHTMMTEERWHGILQCKKDFIDNKIKDPSYCSYMDPEVAASWIRCRKAGVDPLNWPLGEPLTIEQFERSQQENRLLIELAEPIFASFNNLEKYTGLALTLDDKNGIALLQQGVTNYEYIFDHKRLYGKVCSENIIGTCAHVLSRRLKRPVLLFGPEHYCLAFQDFFAASAPILDNNGDIVGNLSLALPLVDVPWEYNFQVICLHTLCLITAMAGAIESKMKLHQSNDDLETVNEQLKTAHDTLDITLAVIDEGIITIDPTGRIVHINKEGRRILHLDKDGDVANRNISEFLGYQSRILGLVARGENAEVEEVIGARNGDNNYVVNIQPVLNPKTRGINGAVLKLNSTEKINALATNRAGRTASYHFEDLIGESKLFKKAIGLGRRFACTAENMLLIGESGTGKELFAQAIHNQERPQGPFIAINCAAIPRDLIESELFGYEGGSFTGAERGGRPGKIELAHGGTLFLDEIGEMPFELQAILLRVLEDKYVIRIGGQRYKKVDFRVVAATNKDLSKMVAKNLFREDLYFRLSVLSINLPPLRDREGDIEILCHYFIDNYCKKRGIKAPKISLPAQRKINEYNWPGNVRQLENAMIYAVNMVQGELIGPDHLPDTILVNAFGGCIQEKNSGEKKIEKVVSLQHSEKAAIENALYYTENNVPAAAVLLQISKSTLYRKLREYNINF